jgi:hypothetical protein
VVDDHERTTLKLKDLAVRLGLPPGSSQAACLGRITDLKAKKASRSIDEAKAMLAKLQIKHGVEPNREGLEQLLATELGNDRFLLGGRVLSGEELEKEMRDQYAEDHALDDLTSGEPLVGTEIDKAAAALLASRGVYEPDARQYLAACQEVGAE